MALRVINVEDDPVIAQLIRAFISSMEGFDLTHFDTAEAAEEALLDGAEADLFLLDIDLPGISGLDLLTRIRQMPQFTETPILMVTLRGDERAVTDAFARGSTDYLQKPLNPLEFQSRMRIFERLAGMQRQGTVAPTAASEQESLIRGVTNTYRPFDVFCNFVATLSRIESAKFQFLAFGITGVAEWQDYKGDEVVDDIMAAMATALAVSFKSDLQLVTRLSHGVLIAACAGQDMVESDQIQEAFEHELRNRVGTDLNAPAWPQVVVGNCRGGSVFAVPSGGTLIRAVENLAKRSEEAGEVLRLDEARSILKENFGERKPEKREKRTKLFSGKSKKRDAAHSA